MKIMILGKFQRMHDEEYIARSFEMLGHEVERVSDSVSLSIVWEHIQEYRPKILLYCKLNNQGNVKEFLGNLKTLKVISVCWVFDLYWGYPREHRLKAPQFKADYVFSTDGGHQKEFELMGINHSLLRQGIYKKECQLLEGEKVHDVVFVGSENPLYPYRTEVMTFIQRQYPQFKWIGRKDTNEVRGMALNELYGSTKIVIGDAVYSQNYWSNRVVETLGRGGFMIHPDVPGITEEYPYLVTYKHKDFVDLKKKLTTT